MAWTAPMTAVTGNVFTASQFNQYVRDNLNTTAPAVATAAARLIVALGANSVGERVPTVGYLGTYESTATTTYTDLATVGPAITLNTGTKALISMGADTANSNAGLGSRVSVTISGATSSAAADGNSYYSESGNAGDNHQGTWTTIYNTLTGGSNTFTMKFRTTAGGGTSTFGHRLVTVTPF